MSTRPPSTRPPSTLPTSTCPTSTSYTRPATGQSRPYTAQSRPGTAVSSRHEGSFIVAVLEGRGVGREVGIAALDKETGQVTLIQLADLQTYIKTLHHIHLHYPSLILVPDTFLAPVDSMAPSSGKTPTSTSLLVQCMQDEFPGVPIEPVLRKYWNEEAGLQFIYQLSVDGEERAATLLAVSSKYYTLSAVCALFKHSEVKLNTRYAARSLRIRYTPVEGTMLIDNESARNLELVGNMLNRKSNHSLYGVLNHTWTSMGSRLLRASLLAPITLQAAIDKRLDAVEELVQNEDVFTAVRDALRSITKLDLDKLIISLAASEARQTSGSKAVFHRVTQMLNLRNIVKNVPLIRDAVKGCHSRLLTVVCESLSDERIGKIENLISKSLNEDATNQKGGGVGALNARVYAVKANFNCLLDVARETFKENVGDIFQLSRDLCDQHELSIQVVHQENGFVFTLKKSDLEESGKGDLPRGFVNVSSRKGKWVFETMELKKRNARMKDAMDETLLLSDGIIQDLVAEVVVEAGVLYEVSEAIALLDMVWSFAHATILRNYVRPEFTGTLAIKAGRHPILETVQSAGSIVANDVYCCDTSSFQIIQGPNMSGKSTYLRQVGLLTVMAMVGCFIPAEYGSFRTHDALLTRLSNDDDIERSLSTFADEMSTSAMILGLSSPDSLVLIDELGRGTSPNEGVGISHAIAERLAERKAFVFFATHFSDLALTLSRQPNVINLHLSVQKSQPTSSSIGLRFNYKIVDGAPFDLEHYGLELAHLADLPTDVLAEAKRVANRLSELEATRKEDSESSRLALRRKAMLRLKSQLAQCLDYSNLPDQELLAYLGRFQKDITQILRSGLFDGNKNSSPMTG